MPRKEGFEGFYDNMLPKEVGKYVKQFGGKVEKADMTQSVEADIMSGEEAETGSIPIWKVNITPEMRKISQTGQMRFMPEGEAKIIDSNIPDKEGGKMRPSTWDSLSKVGYSPEASEKTQIATTAPTYESIVKANATQGMEVLDFSAGRGIGTKAMKAIGKRVGFNVEGYEPFSNEKTRVVAPEYEGEDAINQIPDNSKDIIINNAVLNVVPEDTGRQIVNQIYSKLKPGGSAFINVMGWNNIKNRLDNPKTQLVGPREVVTQKGTFQKGYTAQSLRSLIEQELPDAKIVRTSHGDIGFKVTKPAPPAETMPVINQPAKTGQMRFLPEPVEKLSAFKGKRVQVLTSDLSLVGDVKYGSYTAKFQGGPGYLDNDGWAFTDKDAADGFVTRWERDGKPLIGLASLGSANHLNSLASRKAYAEKWKYLIKSGNLNKEEADAHIKEAMSRVINSDAKKVKPDWRNAAKMITNADDLSNYFDKIPWAAAPMFYEKLTAKTLPIKYPTLVENGLDLESVANEYRQPEYQGADIGDLYAIAEYNGSTPEYRPDLNQAYPWRIKFTKKATLSEMHNVADLTTDPRAFTGKIVGGALAPQPLMVTGIQLDKLISGDIKGSVKPISLQKETLKTKSNKAKEFSSGNPKAYKSYEQIMAERELQKSKPKAKGNASAIANAAKLK
jgi:SAM-dependent methyltransferase